MSTVVFGSKKRNESRRASPSSRACVLRTAYPRHPRIPTVVHLARPVRPLRPGSAPEEPSAPERGGQ
eukprot:1188806-Prorocentrum_minimum.AAC.2